MTISAAPRPVQTTTPQPGASGAIGSVDASARVQAGASSGPTGAPRSGMPVKVRAEASRVAPTPVGEVGAPSPATDWKHGPSPATASHCAFLTSTCDSLDLAPVRLGLRRNVIVMCAGCRRTAAAMGVRIVERRVAQVPVAVERRRSLRPAWLRGDLSRDLTGLVVGR